MGKMREARCRGIGQKGKGLSSKFSTMSNRDVRLTWGCCSVKGTNCGKKYSTNGGYIYSLSTSVRESVVNGLRSLDHILLNHHDVSSAKSKEISS